ncbi:antibiotic biosynthesis monooxygenase [Bradyrhizobium sp. NP1]|uniref:putative quinol monooxygenase n=1 Tax=Bradyrhizobium sp. NP1 TaxID=3049772 RepID=UPI0025A60B4C|nr:antibiotic biosynthesis monooxygenase [Bradyrhizobium sp. NP1]WJR80942.1 antibiotic biosynthesis monooxygenase [Bradyrhizobium sp. NP1]
MEKKIMLVVEFEIKPEHRDKFLTLIHGHARRTRSREEACLQFDVLIPQEKGNKVFLVEAYKDSQSLDSHFKNSGLDYVREIYKDWIVSRTITICDNLI